MCTCIDSTCCCLGKRITCLALSIGLTTLVIMQWSFDLKFLLNCFLVNPASLVRMFANIFGGENPVNTIMQTVVVLVDFVMTSVHVPLAGLLAFACFSKNRILMILWASYVSCVIPWQITALSYLNYYGQPVELMALTCGVLAMGAITLFAVAYSIVTMGL